MFGKFKAIKDSMMTGMAKPRLQELLAPYGKLEALSLESNLRKIALVVHLNGETEPARISVENYQITREGNQVWIEVPAGAFASSREWLTALLNNLVAGRRIELPSAYAKYAEMLL